MTIENENTQIFHTKITQFFIYINFMMKNSFDMPDSENSFRYECGVCQLSQMIKFNKQDAIVTALATTR